MPIPPDIYKKIVDAKVFIDEHFDSPIDLDAIAGEACLSRFHFHRLFRRIYKRTPHQYLTFKRIDHAQRLLGAADCTVGEVVAEVGFESVGSFSMLFKREIGQSPAEFREISRAARILAAEEPRRVIPHCFIAGITAEKSNNQEGGDAGKS
jgi:AraC-like DNA-binding protein